jgi:predicted nucleic acid-binding protein
VSVFVDTGAWFASIVPDDPRHQRVLSWMKSNPLPLVTTDYVVDETLTLLRARGELNRAITMGTQFFDHDVANVFPITTDHARKAWNLFRQQPQRRWSFTDCTSKVIMDELHIRKALAFDHHFEELGSIELLP